MANFCTYCKRIYSSDDFPPPRAVMVEHLTRCEKHPAHILGKALCGLMSLPFPPTTKDLDALGAGVALVAGPSGGDAALAHDAIAALRVFVHE